MRGYETSKSKTPKTSTTLKKKPNKFLIKNHQFLENKHL